MIPTLAAILCAAVVIFICTCRLDSCSGIRRSWRMILAYVPLGMWALYRSGEILHGAPHAMSDVIGIVAIAAHLLFVSPFWSGRERRRNR